MGDPPEIGPVVFERSASYREPGEELRGRISGWIRRERLPAEGEQEEIEEPFQEGKSDEGDSRGNLIWAWPS